MGHDTFDHLVEKSWSLAVSKASSNIEYYKPQLFEALESDTPDMRSAAIASFIEGDVAYVHDEVIALIDDSDEVVRREVIEYIKEYGTTRDVETLFSRLHRDLANISLLSSALAKITGGEELYINEEGEPEEIRQAIAEWQSYLEDNGFIRKK